MVSYGGYFCNQWNARKLFKIKKYNSQSLKLRVTKMCEKKTHLSNSCMFFYFQDLLKFCRNWVLQQFET